MKKYKEVREGTAVYFSGKRVLLSCSNYDKTEGLYRQSNELSKPLHSFISSVPVSIPIHPSLFPPLVSGYISGFVFARSSP